MSTKAFRLLNVALMMAVCLSYSAAFTSPQKSKDKKAAQEGNREAYYKKWLQEDVVWIISEEEKKVFKALNTEEEKESFIEQFWYRRDPDPRTSGNEFKEEHYRRIVYANEHFASGIPGWKTDRGRTYITYGPPAQTESHPSGGSYNREIYEGSNMTSTFPFEKWRYRHLDGIGDDIDRVRRQVHERRVQDGDEPRREGCAPDGTGRWTDHERSVGVFQKGTPALFQSFGCQ